MAGLLSIRKRERVEKLDEEQKIKINKLWTSDVKQYQFIEGKGTKIYPEKNSIFIMKTQVGIELFGIVLNNHVFNRNADEQIVIAIYLKSPISNDFDINDMFINPLIVDKYYWEKGLFVNTDQQIEKKINIDYGFYRNFTNSFCDEYGKELKNEPTHLGCYGISTIHGVAFEIMEELIFRKMI